MHYLDFAIYLDRGPDGAYRAHVQSPAGDASGPVDVSFDPADLARSSSSIVLRLRNGRAHAVDLGLETDVRAMGERLFAGLFSAPILHRFHHSLGGLAADASQGLRIKLQLSLDDPAVARLHALPWELLFRKETNEFLALSRRFTVVRSVSLPVAAHRPPQGLPLRVLVVPSNPLGLPVLALGQEVAGLKRALESREEVKVEILPRADLDCLREALLREEYHVLHFIGHGSFQEGTGEGALFFETEDRYPLPVSGPLLAQHLRDFPSLRMVFLNACQTAQTEAHGPLAGVATALLQAGILAVVAMQFPMTDQAALILSEKIYQRLAQGDPLDAAMAEGRLAIHGRFPHSAEWATPVLLMRTADGQVVPPRSTSGQTPARSRKRVWVGAALLAATGLAFWGGPLILDRHLDIDNLLDSAARPPSPSAVHRELAEALRQPTGSSDLEVEPAERQPTVGSLPIAPIVTPPSEPPQDRRQNQISPQTAPRESRAKEQIPAPRPRPKVYKLMPGEPVFLGDIETDAVADFLTVQAEQFVRLTLIPREGKSVIQALAGPTREPIELSTTQGTALVHVLSIDWDQRTVHLRAGYR